MSKLIYGVAFNSQTKYTARKNGRVSQTYHTWRGMIRRCYSAKAQLRNPTYTGCIVSDDWHDFQGFAEWWANNEFSDLGYDLDKDILTPDNKVYSPDTCVFVPQEINKLLLFSRANKGELPQGIYLHKPTGRYRAQISVDSKRMHLGLFDDVDDAYQAYKEAKESNVKHVAERWRNKIDERVYHALMNWRLTA